MKKHTAGPIEEKIDSVIVFKCSACVLKWVPLKRWRKYSLICRAPQIEVRVLFEGDTGLVPVTVKVPKNL